MTTSFRTLFNCGVLALAAAVTTGCFDNTLDSVSIPENVAWNTMVTGLASPYADLEVLTIGDNITAEITASGGPLLYCGNPTDSSHALADPSELLRRQRHQCTQGGRRPE